MADITELLGYTGPIGREDIQFGKGDETFSVPTSAGGTVLLTKLPSPDAGVRSIVKGVHYPAVTGITDQGAASGVDYTSGNLKRVIDDLASSEASISLPPGDYEIMTNLEIPSNITITLENGAILKPSAGVVLNVGSPAHIKASYRQQIFGGSGSVSFSNGGMFSARWWGAKGDDTNDDTTALQAAIDAAHDAGGRLYIPAGIYKTTGKVSKAWTNTEPGLSEIFGDGIGAPVNGIGTTTIRCYDLSAGEGVLELLGTGNTNSTHIELRDIKLQQMGPLSSPAGTVDESAWCLRIGDSFNALVERVQCHGANGIAVKVASSSSYAQIGSEFRQLNVITNHLQGWYADDYDADAEFYSVKEETGGAFWDTVAFKSCYFMGTVRTRASQANFMNCIFETRSDRNPPYGICAWVYMGSANFYGCYFESYYQGIYIASTSAKIRNVCIDNCQFTGNLKSGSSQFSSSAIFIGEGATPAENVVVRSPVFNTAQAGEHSDGDIDIYASMTQVSEASAIGPPSGVDDLTSGGAYSGSVSDIFYVEIDSVGSPDTFKWRRRNSGSWTSGVSITGAAQTLADGVTVTFGSTTGHTSGSEWQIFAGYGGCLNVTITDPVYRQRHGEPAFNVKPLISVDSNFTNNLFVKYASGEIVGNGMPGFSGQTNTVPTTNSPYSKTLMLSGGYDTSALDLGQSPIGIELQNLTGASGGDANPGCATAFSFRGIYSTIKSRFGALFGGVTDRNSSTLDEAGVVGIATKAIGGTLTERVRWTEDGAMQIKEVATTPADPPAENAVNVYMKSDNLVFHFLDGSGNDHFFRLELDATSTQSLIYSAGPP